MATDADYCPECRHVLLWSSGMKMCCYKPCSKYGIVVK